jgi:TonB family protein
MSDWNGLSHFGAAITVLLLVTTSAVAQQPQTEAAPSGVPAPDSVEHYLPSLPPSIVPPRIMAPHPCTFPHSALYDHPTMPAIVTFTVTANGQVTNPSIARSSGSSHVDEGARECITKWVYAPALRDGIAVDQTWATEISLTITTRSGLPQPPPDAPQGSKFIMMPVEKYRATVSGIAGCQLWHPNAARGALIAFDVEADGSVKNASVAETSGDPAIDKDAVDCVSQRVYKPATRDGEPIEIRLTAALY